MSLSVSFEESGQMNAIQQTMSEAILLAAATYLDNSFGQSHGIECTVGDRQRENMEDIGTRLQNLQSGEAKGQSSSNWKWAKWLVDPQNHDSWPMTSMARSPRAQAKTF